MKEGKQVNKLKVKLLEPKNNNMMFGVRKERIRINMGNPNKLSSIAKRFLDLFC